MLCVHRRHWVWQWSLFVFAGLLLHDVAWADPCGMVPPITADPDVAITRIGIQKTYVFYKNGVESFVIRPGFRGKVSDFGMLIPFPTPPAIRKIPDKLFSHIAAAIDPPEISVRLYPRPRRRYKMRRKVTPTMSAAPRESEGGVRVLRQEAVGMYQVAVLEAGSAKALKTWMDNNKYKYPTGMDKPVTDYVKAGWCFVAVKTRVSGASSVSPRPGMRKAIASRPLGSSFDGHVQGMGFRFFSKELVVPMRLSAFNKGKLRNIVYLLTDSGQQVKHIPEGHVVRQSKGSELYDNVTLPLPIRIIDLKGTETKTEIIKRLKARYGKGSWLHNQRNPEPHVKYARELFASDLLSAKSKSLILDFEKLEKAFLNLGEFLNMRGPSLDALHNQTLSTMSVKTLAGALVALKEMVLTVVDADFPRDVIARDNLHFSSYEMNQEKNSPRHYQTRRAAPATHWKEEGRVVGNFDKINAYISPYLNPELLKKPKPLEVKTPKQTFASALVLLLQRWWVLLFVLGIAAVIVIYTRIKGLASWLFWIGLGASLGQPALCEAATKQEIKQWIKQLGQSDKAQAALVSLVKEGEAAMPYVKGAAIEGTSLLQRGWAIACLGKLKATKELIKLYDDTNNPKLVRAWAVASHIMATEKLSDLEHIATNRLYEFPSLKRPLGLRLVTLLQSQPQGDITRMLLLFATKQAFRQSLTPMIMKRPITELVQSMLSAKKNPVRRIAAGYLAAFRSKEQKQGMSQTLIKYLSFSPGLKEVPWKGGALFVPGINWRQHKRQARQLVQELIAWMLWCDQRGDKSCHKQIHNNIRSWGLGRAIGYSGTWRQRSAEGWLRVWRRIVGAKTIRAMFQNQGLLKKGRYKAMYRRIIR